MYKQYASETKSYICICADIIGTEKWMHVVAEKSSSLRCFIKVKSLPVTYLQITKHALHQIKKHGWHKNFKMKLINEIKLFINKRK